MRCGKCGNENAEGAKFCKYCGTGLVQAAATFQGGMGAQEKTMSMPGMGSQEKRMSMENMRSQEETTVLGDAGDQAATRYQGNMGAQMTMRAPYSAPALQLPTNRGVAKMILLSLITFGIYGMVTWCKMVTEINITASRYDGKRTCPYFAMIWLNCFTYGIFGLVWQHKFSNRVGAEVRRRGYNYNFSAADMWLWGILGSLIIVGPFIYCHKLMKSMNMINTSYNICG